MLKKSIFHTLVGVVTAGALMLSVSGAAQATETSHISEITVKATLIEHEIDIASFGEALHAIEDIPDSALQSEETFEKWKTDYFGQQAQTRASVLGCAWGITKATFSNIFVFSKVAKLKSVIKSAGGAKAVAQKAITAYKKAREDKKSRREAIVAASEAAAINGGEQAVNLFLEFFSIDGIISGCFSD